MSDYWRVLGRFCVDESFQKEFLSIASPITDPDQFYERFVEVHNMLCQANDFLLTRWDIADLHFFIARIGVNPVTRVAAQELAKDWGKALPSSDLLRMIGLMVVDSNVRDRYLAPRTRKDLSEQLALAPRFDAVSDLEMELFQTWIGKPETKTRLELIDADWVYPRGDRPGDMEQVAATLKAIRNSAGKKSCSSGHTMSRSREDFVYVTDPMLGAVIEALAKDGRGWGILWAEIFGPTGSDWKA